MKQRRLPLLALTVLVPLMLGMIANAPVVNAAPGFNIILSPGSQMADSTINQYAYYAVEIQSTGGFFGIVQLTASISPSHSGAPSLSFPGGSSVSVPLDGSGFTYLMATVGSLAYSYTPYYTITVLGSSTSPVASASTTTSLVVQLHNISYPRDFRLGSTPGTIIDVATGGSGTLQINVYSQTNNAIPQSVSLLVAPSIPSLISVIFTPSIVKVASYSTNVSILTVSTTLLTPARNYTLVITGSNDDGVVHSWAITVRVSGFYLSAPTTKSVIRGKSGTVSVGITSVGTFNLPVNLSATGVPTNMTVIFNPSSVTPPPGETVSSVLTISTTSSLAAGTYILALRGASGPLTSQQSISISVGDFSISATPLLRTAAQNTTTTFTVNGTSSDDYYAVMTLGIHGLPSEVTPTFSPSSMTIPAGGSASSTLSLAISASTPVGTYPLNISGTSGSQTHVTNVTLVIVAAADFTLTISPTSATVRNGSSTAFTITVNSINDFISAVALTVSIPSGSGVTGSIAPSSVTPTAGGYATATLTVTAAATAPTGTGTITITGTGGGKTRTKTATLTVSITGGPCIIATAAYGSEIAPEVYFLRLFRDSSVQATFAGNQFMNVFNAWYYSFSPTVAEQVRNNLVLRNIVRAALYPLIGALYLAQWSYSVLCFAPELAVVVAGLVATSLIGIVYFAPIALLAAELARRKQMSVCPFGKPLAAAWVTSIVMIAVAELTAIPTLMMFATAAFVLSTLALATNSAVIQAQRILH